MFMRSKRPRAGRIWTYEYKWPDVKTSSIRGARGIAYGDGRIYMGTQDNHVVALDAKTGAEIWNVHVEENSDCQCRITAAPLFVKGKVITGNAGSGYQALRGTGILTRMTRKPALSCGTTKPFPLPANRALKPGPGLMKLHHQRFVFRTDGADHNLVSIAQRPGSNILHGIRTDRRLRQLIERDVAAVQDDSGIESQQTIRRSQQRVDINFRNPRLFEH